jgi:hypothetical protein
MLMAAVAGGLLAATVLALISLDLCAALFVAPIGSATALAAGTPFAVAVTYLYRDLPLAEDPAHWVFWCILSFLLGAVFGVAPALGLIQILEAAASC